MGERSRARDLANVPNAVHLFFIMANYMPNYVLNHD